MTPRQIVKAAVKHTTLQPVNRGPAAAVVIRLLWELDDGLRRTCTVQACILNWQIMYNAVF